MPPKQKLVIIGNGMASSRLLSELMEIDSERFLITVVGAEPGPAYNRILLSAWLSGSISDDEIILNPRSWYQRHGIDLHDNDPAIEIDTRDRKVITASQQVLDYDLLVLATGSHATRLSIPGHDAEGVMCLRSLQDARSLQNHIAAAQPAVVIGGGLLGLEAACSLADKGMDVTVLHNAAWPMNRQLDSEAGQRLAENLQQRGITFKGDAHCVRFCTDTDRRRVSALELADGTRLPCTIAIMALGITPETRLARQAGLDIDRAVRVDPWLRTSAADIFALGECCQLGNDLFGLVEPVYKQARVLATVLHTRATTGSVAIERLPAYQHQTTPTRLKVSGVDVFSAGEFLSAGHDKTIAWRDHNSGHYRRLWWRNNRLVAAVMFGDISGNTRYARLIEDRTYIASPKRALFGLEAGL